MLIELNKKSHFINIYLFICLAADAIDMLHVNNNCTDILEKLYFVKL